MIGRPIPRRAFLAGAGSSLLAAPAVVRAQQLSQQKRLAILSSSRTIDELRPDGTPRLAAFHRELRRRGWIIGVNLVVEYWSSRGLTDVGPLVRRIYESTPNIVFVGGYLPFAEDILRWGSSTPTVILGTDPLESGIVKSLSRPDGSVTGFTSDAGIEVYGKRLQLLTEAVPTARRISYFGPDYGWEQVSGVLREAASKLGLSIEQSFYPRGATDSVVRDAFNAMARTVPGGVIFGAGAENSAYAVLLGRLTLQFRLPAVGGEQEIADAGALIGYGPDRLALYSACAGYVDEILRGKKPSDLPIQQPREFELVINKRTATALGLEIPLGLYVQATEIIE